MICRSSMVMTTKGMSNTLEHGCFAPGTPDSVDNGLSLRTLLLYESNIRALQVVGAQQSQTDNETSFLR